MKGDAQPLNGFVQTKNLLSKEEMRSRFFPLILQQPLPQREDLDTVAILFHDILLVLCHDHHSLEALNGGNAYQPEGLGVRHRITFFGLYVILVDWLRISPLQTLTVWLGVCHV